MGPSPSGLGNSVVPVCGDPKGSVKLAIVPCADTCQSLTRPPAKPLAYGFSHPAGRSVCNVAVSQSSTKAFVPATIRMMLSAKNPAPTGFCCAPGALGLLVVASHAPKLPCPHGPIPMRPVDSEPSVKVSTLSEPESQSGGLRSTF